MASLDSGITSRKGQKQELKRKVLAIEKELLEWDQRLGPDAFPKQNPL